MSDKSDKKELVGDEMELEKSEDGKMTEGEFTSGSNDNASQNTTKSICGYKLEGITLVVLGVLGVSLAVTIAFILDIIFGSRPTKFHGAVSSESTICSDLGIKVLKDGGNAIDSAVVTALCLTLVRPDVASLAGCGQLLFLKHHNMSSTVLDGQCEVPKALVSSSPETMATKGEASVAVPGFLPMLFNAHNSYGKIRWSRLIEKVTNMSVDDISVSSQMRMSNTDYKDSNVGSLPKELSDSYKAASFKPNAKIRELLNKMSEAKSISDITSGSLSQEIVDAASKNGGKMSLEDLKSFDVKMGDAITGHLSGESIITTSGSSWGGPFIAASLNILNDYGVVDEPAFYHTMIEVFKQVQLKAATLGDEKSSESVVSKMLGKDFVTEIRSKINGKKVFKDAAPQFVPFSTSEDHGGTSLSVIDPDNLHVSMTLSLGSPYGSGVVTASGVILNNALSLFADKKDKDNTKNVIQKEGQKPLTGMAPVIVYNPQRKCGPRVMLGANHGTRAGTGLVQWIISAISFDKSVCIDSDCLSLNSPAKRPRLDAKFGGIKLPDNKKIDVLVEKNFPASVFTYLKNLGHTVATIDAETDVLQIINAVGKVQNSPTAITDPRNKGQSAAHF